MVSAVVTSTSVGGEELAATDTARQLAQKSGGAPIRGGILFTTVDHDTTRLQAALRLRVPGVPFVGTTSCLGVGAASTRYAHGRHLAGLWLLGDGFRFGVAAADKSGKDPVAIGREVAGEALAQGGFSAAEARLAVLHATPGGEEALLTGIYQTLDRQTSVIGGTAADDDISGNWSSFTHERVTRNGVVLALSDWPWKLIIHYQAGYLPAGKRGRVTRSDGRRLLTIDDRPAAEVYNAWLGGKLTRYLTSGGNVMAETTMNPLGIPRSVGVAQAYVLVHPQRVLVPERSLALFANIAQGQEVVLMTSWPEALIQRSASVARSALALGKLTPNKVVGGLLIYCAGCMLAIRDRVPDMLVAFQSVVGSIPYVSAFTYGEQGNVLPGLFDHGNLMANLLLLSGE